LQIIGIAFIWLWFSELEAETLNVGNLLKLGQPEPRSAPSSSVSARAQSAH
jgi:hypothetical protein